MTQITDENPFNDYILIVCIIATIVIVTLGVILKYIQ